MPKTKTRAVYDPHVFDVQNERQARDIILTQEKTLTPDQRWDRETPHLLKLLRLLRLKESSLVLDFGCGIGRLAAPLIGQYNCTVVGADISPSMRALAADYVKSPKFIACDPSMVGLFPQFDAVLAIWVIQHVRDLDAEIARIANVLRKHGRLFLLNEKSRCLPTNAGWVNDGKDTRKSLAKCFDLVSEAKLDPNVVGKDQSARTFWAMYEKK